MKLKTTISLSYAFGIPKKTDNILGSLKDKKQRIVALLLDKNVYLSHKFFIV